LLAKIYSMAAVMVAALSFERALRGTVRSE
jgi:hypothetical protein